MKVGDRIRHKVYAEMTGTIVDMLRSAILILLDSGEMAEGNMEDWQPLDITN